MQEENLNNEPIKEELEQSAPETTTKKEKTFKNKLINMTKKRKNIKLSHILIGFGIFLAFLVITNPSIIPFLPDDAKLAIRGTWERVFGDVGKISNTFTLSWATIFQVIAIILLLVVVTMLISFILDHLKLKSPKGRSIVSLLRSGIKYIAVIIGFFWCLAALGVNVSTIFASVGIVALVIGFGAQSLVEDLVTGIFLVFEDQFNVGDIIEVGGFRGTVDSIGIRTTAIRDVGDNVKIINNSDLRNILNRSTSLSYAVTTVSIAYKSDIEYVEKVISEFLPKIREKYPDKFEFDPKYLGVQSLGESGIQLKFVAQVQEKDIFSVPRILNREIKVYFDKAGIEIPFNQIVVHNGDK